MNCYEKKSAAVATLLIVGAMFFPRCTFAATSDLSITQSAITFSKSTFYVDDTVRIYAKVRNIGETDIIASVYFYQGPTIIGTEQNISMPAGGAVEEVFVDFTVPSSAFNIRAIIQGATPADEDASNNEATTPLYTPVADIDRDGAVDSGDNCDTTPNADQTDTDHDGRGDTCDTDDDNDSVSDAAEQSAATNPLNPDSDGDGVKDSADNTPTVANRADTTAKNAVATPSVQTSSPHNASSSTSVVSLEDPTNTATASFPTSAYGVLNNDTTTPDVAPEEDAPSFFRLNNPLLLMLIGVGLLVVLALILAILTMRRRDTMDV